ncbi:nuclear transport factor 2 family protein [Polaribacter tangerinus]|uniref:nuclear transport factor 2 family protein n=1 Tax=Polaribacter tangerinus TaxID=1920034 RepID=UPI000B4BAD08|nr:nuclear transport factor 2 family protein [Polaribacter tangerinus]
MTKSSVLIIAIFLLLACKKSDKNIVNKQQEKTTIDSLLTAFHKGATDADYHSFFNKLDKEAVYIGTAAEEVWSKKAFEQFSKPYFDAGKAWDFKTLERTVYISKEGNFAWFNELLNTWMGTCRGSGVLEKKQNTWQIKQYVLSVAIPNNDIQKVIAVKKENDALFLEKYNNE